MSRLTENDIIDILAISIVDLQGSELLTKIIEMATDLLEYKKVEEQLGCPLEVVFKALTNGVYVKDFPNESNTLKMFGLNLTNIENEWYMITKFYANVKVKDYKKTWWLKADKSE